MRKSVIVCAGIVAAAASSANAQLVFGTTSSVAGNPMGVYLNVNSGSTTTLWNTVANKKLNGLAADTANGKIYGNDAARLHVWSYGSVGTAPTAIAGMYRTNGSTFAATGVDGLAWANGQLYGSTSFGSTVYKRGIYQINTTPDSSNRCIMTALWTDPTGIGTLSGTVQFGGIDYNAADGKFWVTNGTDTTGSGGTYERAIYTVDAFGSGAMVKVADFPLGRTQIDGLAIGGGYAWLTEQAPSSSTVNIYGYNLSTGVYDKSFTFTLTDPTQRASAATWAPDAYLPIPSPAAGAVLALASVCGLRRRR